MIMNNLASCPSDALLNFQRYFKRGDEPLTCILPYRLSDKNDPRIEARSVSPGRSKRNHSTYVYTRAPPSEILFRHSQHTHAIPPSAFDRMEGRGGMYFWSLFLFSASTESIDSRPCPDTGVYSHHVIHKHTKQGRRGMKRYIYPLCLFAFRSSSVGWYGAPPATERRLFTVRRCTLAAVSYILEHRYHSPGALPL